MEKLRQDLLVKLGQDVRTSDASSDCSSTSIVIVYDNIKSSNDMQNILVDRLAKEVEKHAEVTTTLSGSELLGTLKKEIALEKIASERMWELLNEDDFYKSILEYEEHRMKSPTSR